jgi:hypothetical protein
MEMIGEAVDLAKIRIKPIPSWREDMVYDHALSLLVTKDEYSISMDWYSWDDDTIEHCIARQLEALGHTVYAMDAADEENERWIAEGEAAAHEQWLHRFDDAR